MKLVTLVVALILVATSAFGASITLTIPNEKLEEVTENILTIYPNSEKDKTDPENPVAKYTDNQWLREILIRFVKTTNARGKQVKEQKAITYTLDDTVAS